MDGKPFSRWLNKPITVSCQEHLINSAAVSSTLQRPDRSGSEVEAAVEIAASSANNSDTLHELPEMTKDLDSENALTTDSTDLSTQEPLSAWRFPITEADSVFLPSVPFIFEEETVLVSSKNFKQLLTHSLFLQKTVQATVSDGEEKQGVHSSLQVNKQAVDLRDFGLFTRQSLEQALEALRTKRITKKGIEEGGIALLESLSLTETTVFALEKNLITEEFETAESAIEEPHGNAKKEPAALAHVNVQVSLNTNDTTVAHLANLLRFPNIRKLELVNCEIRDFSVIGALENLEELRLSWTSVSDISFLQNLQKLRKLEINCPQLRDFSAIGALENLEELILVGRNDFDASFLQELRTLRKLEINCPELRDFSAIGALENLEELNLSFTNVSDISFLKALVNLKTLNLAHGQCRDFSVIGALRNLEGLNLSFTNVSDVSFLQELSKLRTLNLDHCKQLRGCRVEMFSRAGLKITEYYASGTRKMLGSNSSKEMPLAGPYRSYRGW